MNEKELNFILFCVENYASSKNIKSGEMVNLFSEKGLLEDLVEFYDMLHTQGLPYIIEYIDEYLENRGVIL